jgi:hypothetical protein
MLLWQNLGTGAPSFKTVKKSISVVANDYGPQHEWVKLAAEGYRNAGVNAPLSV